MREGRLWARLLGVEGAIVESVEEGEQSLVLSVRLRPVDSGRCSVCRRQCPGYDRGEGRRQWRALDLGLFTACVEAAGTRVSCPEHGVGVEHVPWARPRSQFTRHFEDTVAWLAARTDKTTVGRLFRVVWRTVGRIIERVTCEARANCDLFAGIKRIGVDEVSYRRGHRYLTVVVDHDSGRLLFAHEGKNEVALDAFFDALGPERCAAIELVSMDAGVAYQNVVRKRCPKAQVCMDPFHVVKWATDAVDKVRRRVWNEARRSGLRRDAVAVKGTRYAVLKNPEDLTEHQRIALAQVEQTNRPLFRAYLLKEQLREVFKLKGTPGIRLLDQWLAWARRCRIPDFVAMARTVSAHRAMIDAALRHQLSNARVEALNTRMQLLTRVAFGFHSSAALISLAMLKLGGLCPRLPSELAHGASS